MRLKDVRNVLFFFNENKNDDVVEVKIARNVCSEKSRSDPNSISVLS